MKHLVNGGFMHFYIIVIFIFVIFFLAISGVILPILKGKLRSKRYRYVVIENVQILIMLIVIFIAYTYIF